MLAIRRISRLAAAAALLGAAAPVTAQTQTPTTRPRGATDVGRSQTLPARRGATSPPPRRTVVFPAGWPHLAGRAATTGRRAMVVSDAPLASEAGIEILRRGGNAVDAAVAVAFALAVVYPEAGNIGGGGYMVVRMANGRTAALDFREVAPLAARRDMYLDSTGAVTDQSRVGPLASGVPGAVAGLVAAQARFGTMSLAAVMGPAIRYADRGFVVNDRLAGSLEGNRSQIEPFAGAALFLPGGAALRPGATLQQPALARTLRAVAARGRRGFYEGPVAEAWTSELRSAGGIITVDDLKRYRPIWRTPIRSTYRGHTVLSMPPSSSGGVTMTETLNILEGFDSLPSFGGAGWAHLVGSASQRAFIDRNSKLGDPAFVRVPLAELVSKRYAAGRRATIDRARATSTAALTPPLGEGTQTTHASVVDARGNAVALTTTLNDLYGSGVYLASSGFFLNDEMDDFTSKPGVPNMYGLVQGEANAIEPGKRMLSAMTPTIVLDRRGRLLLVLGSRGGPRIISSVTQVVLNVVEYGMPLADAMSAPRLHHQSLPDTLKFETAAITPAVADSLRAMGHHVFVGQGVGLVNAVMRTPGGYEGVSDPRGGGQALGY